MSQQAGDYIRSIGEEWSNITPEHEYDLDLDMIAKINAEESLRREYAWSFEDDANNIPKEFFTPPTAEDEYYGSVRGGCSCLIPLLASILVICMLFWGLGTSFNFIRMPDISFLQKSAELKKDPALQALKKAVVSISVPQTNATGTGFNISAKGTIITNRHVVEGASFINIKFPDGSRFVANDWQVMADYDLAVIHLDNPKGKELSFVELSVTQPEPGERIIFIGNPLGFDWTVSEGVYNGIIPLGDGTESIIFDGPVRAGSSGSPIFNSEGLVIGVIYARFTDVPDSGLAVPIWIVNSE